MEAAILAAMHNADLPPEFAYAYRKTGLLGLAEDKSLWPPENIKEWNDAVDEYRAIQAASSRPDKPKGWNTQIPELLISPFTQQDYDQVRECTLAIAPIEARGMKVVTRVELAAALLAAACDHARLAEAQRVVIGEEVRADPGAEDGDPEPVDQVPQAGFRTGVVDAVADEQAARPGAVRRTIESG